MDNKSLDAEPTSVDLTLNKMSQSQALDLLRLKPENESAEWKHEYAQRLLEAAMFSEDFDIRRQLYKSALQHEAEARKLNLANEEAATPQMGEMIQSASNKDLVIVVKKSPPKTKSKKKKKRGFGFKKKKKEPITFVLDLTDDDGDTKDGKEKSLNHMVTTANPILDTGRNVQGFDPVHTPTLQKIDESSLLTGSKDGKPFVMTFDDAVFEEDPEDEDEAKQEPRSAFAHLADDFALIGDCLAGMLGITDDDDFSCARGSCVDENGTVTSYACSDWSCGSYSTVGTSRESSFNDDPLTFVVKKNENGGDQLKLGDPNKKLVWLPIKDPKTGKIYFYHRVTRQTTWTEVGEEDRYFEDSPAGSALADEALGEADTSMEEEADEPGQEQPEDNEQEPPKREKPSKPVWMSNTSAEHGIVYYYNRETRQASWTKPRDFDEQHSTYNAALEAYRESQREQKQKEEEAIKAEQNNAADEEGTAGSIIEEQDVYDDDDDTPVRLLIKRGNRIEVLRIATLTPLDLLEDASLGNQNALAQIIEEEPEGEQEGDVGQEIDLALTPFETNSGSEKKRLSLGPLFRKSLRKVKDIKKKGEKKGVVLVVEETNGTHTSVTMSHETQNVKSSGSSRKENPLTSMFQGLCRPQNSVKSFAGKMNCVLVKDDEDIVTEGESSFEETPTNSPTKGQEVIYVGK